MANRVLISVQEELEPPSWLDNVEPFVNLVMEKFGFDGEEISILFCNDEYMRELNNNFRGIDSPTDVLSFETAMNTKMKKESGNVQVILQSVWTPFL